MKITVTFLYKLDNWLKLFSGFYMQSFLLDCKTPLEGKLCLFNLTFQSTLAPNSEI